ncbi:helix-turn-helix domain-containing protein [Aliihoeflea sp. PC F10.4]
MMNRKRSKGEKVYGGSLFPRSETHQVGFGPQSTLYSTSEAASWSFAYVSRQTEQPYQQKYDACPHTMIAVMLGSSVGVTLQMRNWRKREELAPGGFSIVPGGMSFEVGIDTQSETLLLYLNRSTMISLSSELGDGDTDAVELLPQLGVVDPFVEYAARSLFKVSQGLSPVETLYAEQVTNALAAYLIVNHSRLNRSNMRGVRPARLEAGLLRRVHEYINANVASPILLEQIAKQVGMSTVRFYRAFKLETGQTPYQYVLKLRIEYARRMIDELDKPLAQIAVESGFANQTHFTRIFKKIVGVSPGVYRGAGGT